VKVARQATPARELAAELDQVTAGAGVAVLPYQERLLALDSEFAYSLQNLVQGIMGYLELDQLELFLSAEEALDALRRLPPGPRRGLIKHLTTAIHENVRTKDKLRSSLRELSRVIYARVRDIHVVGKEAS